MSSGRPIRVLWFVNAPFPAVDAYLGKPEYVGTGSWLKASLIEMVKFEKFEEDGTVYYLLPLHPLPVRKKNKLNRIWSHLKRIYNLLKPHKYTAELRDCVRAVDDFRPDLVHVWGTESFYGLISNLINIPVLIRLQGLLSVIKDDYWGGVKWRERIFMPNEMLSYIDIRNKAVTELKIIKQNKYFEGRTFWDHSHVRAHNVSASYYDISVMMRSSFYGPVWLINNTKKHSVYITARSQPLKGTTCLIQALSIVRKYVPDVQLRVGGIISKSGYGRYLKKMVADLALDDCVTFLGPLSEKEIVNELLGAHVYVLSSYIENECNSLIEAQMVGVPCVAAYVGGVTTTVADQLTGLLFHKGDSATLAMNIQKIFNDDALALNLSRGAREFALGRYEKNSIVNATISAYKDMLGQAHGG
jgi:glycosyltransferase involved in cell wall biosynthesis